MDSVRVGLALRALRRQRGWTQTDLARRARISQASVSRAERGNASDLTVRTLTAIAEALGARVALRVLWQGEALDRLLDAAHAGLVDEVVRLLRARGWEVIPEATFSEFGERGSIDVLAWHPASGALLVIEVKSAVPDMGALLAGVDRKARLAPRLAESRGWRVTCASRILVLPDHRTARRRASEHAATLGAVFPARTVELRRWLRDPHGAVAGILFLPRSQSTTARHRVGVRRSARVAAAGAVHGRAVMRRAS